MHAKRGLGIGLGLLVLGAITLPSLPGAAEASNSGGLDFDKQCYVVGEHPTVSVTGRSFDPGLNLEFQLLKGEAVVQRFPVTTDAEGRFSLSFPNPGETLSTH